MTVKAKTPEGTANEAAETKADAANGGTQPDGTVETPGEEANEADDAGAADETGTVDQPDPEKPEAKAESDEKVDDEGVTEEVSGLKKDLKVERTRVTNLTKEREQLSEQVEQLQAKIKARNEAEMADLSDDEKALVMDFAGGDEAPPQSVFDALTKARKHKLISVAGERPRADRHRTAGGDITEESPKSWAEADARSGFRTH